MLSAEDPATSKPENRTRQDRTARLGPAPPSLNSKSVTSAFEAFSARVFREEDPFRSSEEENPRCSSFSFLDFIIFLGGVYFIPGDILNSIQFDRTKLIRTAQQTLSLSFPFFPSTPDKLLHYHQPPTTNHPPSSPSSLSPETRQLHRHHHYHHCHGSIGDIH